MKKRIVIISSILLLIIGVGIYFIYGTLAVGTSTSEGEVYNFDITDDSSIVTVPANSYKTVFLKIKNTNNGTVRYGIGYTNQSNIEILAYNGGFDEMTGLIKKNEYKFIKLRVINNSSSSQSTKISTILGYENGGELIVPSDKGLVNKGYTPPQKLTTYITNLYNNASKTEVTNNSITYNYADIYDTDTDDTSSGGLMNDRLGKASTPIDGGNIRYYGANPNNYIYFNCSNYLNQSSSTCELWRIIGVFKDVTLADGTKQDLVKIIRNDSIANLAWDQDKNINSSLTTYDNNWHTASLQVLLNQKYYNGNTAGTVTYFFGKDGGTSTKLNMSSIGLKNDTTRNKIAEVKWNLGGWNTSSGVYPNSLYEYERGTAKCSSCTYDTVWPGKIALMYPSDYGYATDFSKCTSKEQYNYATDTNCTENDWLFNSKNQWLLTPNSGYSSNAWYVFSSGGVSNSPGVCNANGVRAVLYLNSEHVIVSGDGSQSNPFKLSV